jgi:dsDNA-binding SOS-regulon protein
MGDLAMKTSKFMKQSVQTIEEEEEDELAAFISRG